MTITIIPTTDFTTVDGRRSRVWRGRDDQDRECVVFVSRVAYLEPVDGDVPLKEIDPPRELADVATVLRNLMREFSII